MTNVMSGRCGCNAIVARASLKMHKVERAACADKRRTATVAKAGLRDSEKPKPGAWFLLAQPSKSLEDMYLRVADIIKRENEAGSKLWPIENPDKPVRMDVFPSLAECKAGYDEAMAKLNAPPKEPCPHGEWLACTPCFNASLSAWCPQPGEDAPAFFGVEKPAATPAQEAKFDRESWLASLKHGDNVRLGAGTRMMMDHTWLGVDMVYEYRGLFGPDSEVRCIKWWSRDPRWGTKHENHGQVHVSQLEPVGNPATVTKWLPDVGSKWRDKDGVVSEVLRISEYGQPVTETEDRRKSSIYSQEWFVELVMTGQLEPVGDGRLKGGE